MMASNEAPLAGPLEAIMARAAALAAQPCPLARPAPTLWAMLTAVSPNARERPQGTHILLQNSEHVLGRTVREASCLFESANVSGRHCTISRRYIGAEGRVMANNHVPDPATDRLVACIRDSSSNGTYVNLQRLQRNGEEVQLRHGDVVSLVGTPENATAFSFVYREVSDHVIGAGAASAAAALASISPGEPAGPSNKRKGSPVDDAGETIAVDGKRIKGLGNGGVSGPIMLNDVRQLQRSNEELRVLVEAHVLEVEKMRSEHRSAEARHASELKEVRAAVEEKFSAQQEELKRSLATKEAEGEAGAALRLQLESNIELLQQRLASEAKSRVDAEEVIDGLKSRVAELEKFLEEERSKVSKERAEAEASLRAALDRIRVEAAEAEASLRAALDRFRVEAAEELKRHEETAIRQQEQQNDIILALQEGEKDYRAAAEISRKKLDSERAAVVAAEERARRLESQLQEERVLSLTAQNRVDDFEVKLRQTCSELEDEKIAREGAQVRIARLEVDMEAASRDLKLEKQRLQGARERIVLRETQLRAFHSTAAEIADLQQRQQDQLLTMIRTLEDGDSENDHDNTNVRSTSRSTRAPLHFSEHQGSKRIKGTKGTSQSTSGSGPTKGENMGSKRTVVQDDEKSKGTAMDDDTEGDTQQDGCSNASHSATRSSDVNIPPTQVLDFKIASTYDEAGYLQRVHGRSELLQFTSGDNIGGTQLENGEVGFTQIANVDAGCTQLLSHEPNLIGVSPLFRGIVVNANQGLSTGQDEIPTVHRDEAEPMEEEINAHPDNMRVRTGLVIDNTEQWDDGADEARRFSFGTSQAEAVFRESMTDSRRHPRDSLCTADLLASEVAGSWAFATPASAHGENDSSSAEPAEPAEPPIRRASDEGAEYAASQVATNNVAGEKPPEGNAEGKPPTEVDTEANDVDMDMSQTTPKQSNIASGEAQTFQETEQGAGDVVPNLAVYFQEHGRRAGGGSRDDSSDTSSTEDGSREDGEIGASEPVSPFMYAQ